MAFRIVEMTPVKYKNDPVESGGVFQYQQIDAVYYVKIEADTFDDIPDSPGSIETEAVHGSLVFAIGSRAHTIDTNKIYAYKSDGTWVEQDEASRLNVYTQTQIDEMLANLVGAQAIVDGDQDLAITANRTDIEYIVDHPQPKNVLNLLSATTQTINGITFTVNADYSITMSGTAESTTFFSIPVTIQPGSYYFTGMPEAGGSGTYRLELRSPTATGTVRITCEDVGEVSWGPTEVFTGYFNIRVASGYQFSEPKTVKPMIDLRLKHRISSNYVPYEPSTMDLLRLIQSYHP